jgi:thiol:disulfide interchange protein
MRPHLHVTTVCIILTFMLPGFVMVILVGVVGFALGQWQRFSWGYMQLYVDVIYWGVYTLCTAQLLTLGTLCIKSPCNTILTLETENFYTSTIIYKFQLLDATEQVYTQRSTNRVKCVLGD